MKKITFLACAAMLASAVVFTGCKNDKNEEVLENLGEEVVKTQFSIALPGKTGNGVRRMPGATTQKDASGDLSKFLGMDGITLVPFAKQGVIDGSTDLRLGANITTAAGNPMTIGSGAGTLGTNSKAKVFNDVNIPLSTASFLFYAKSALTGDKFDVGSLNPNDLTTQPNLFRFGLEVIHSDGLFGAGTPGEGLLTYLNSIVVANDGETPTPNPWYSDAIDNEALKAMFATFSSMKGLSSFEVARVLTDLNKSLAPLDASNTLAHNIRLAINNGTYVTVDGSDVVTMKSPYDQFPQEYNIPVGSVNIKWNATSHEFEEGLYSNMARPDNYVYPAQLWYYVNSQIKTSNSSKQTMYDNSNDWAAILAAHTDAISVNTLTRAVAIEDPIQYAVARFDLDVKVKNVTEHPGSLEDNSESAEGAKKNIEVKAVGFPVTGVIIGGQRQVKYDFTPDDAATEYTIYDKNMDQASMAAKVDVASSPNYTLVLESKANTDVMVAVEMENNTGVDFYGVDNQLIPAGSKFYVVGQLLAADATDTPLTTAGKANRVFAQDFTTTAHLTLKDLKHAYNTIPDLRTPKLELGFSVDLTWQNGHTYSIEF